MRFLPDDNLSYPVLLEIGETSGSGFYFRTDTKIFVVTALHVLYKEKEGINILRNSTLRLTSYDKNLDNTSPIEFIVDLTKVQIRKNDIKDIVLIEIAKISYNPATTQSGPLTLIDGVSVFSKNSEYNLVVVPPQHLKKFEQVLVSNDVYILGFPNSLGTPGQQEIETKKPLLRKGIVAGKNTSNGTIILDCPVYFGNSGGMAIEVENNGGGRNIFSVIGVISRFIPFVEFLNSAQLGYTNLNFENSGYSVIVPIDTILELTKEAPEVTHVEKKEACTVKVG